MLVFDWIISGRHVDMPLVLSAGLLLLILTLLIILFFGSGFNSNHRYRISQAKSLWNRFHSEKWNAKRKTAYLKKVHPNTFEEYVLVVFENAGWKVRRNSSYSGDGGVDGMARNPSSNQEYLLQMKRYSGYIKMEQVREFGELCRKKGKAGYFIYTGRCGKGTLELEVRYPIIIIEIGELENEL